MVLRPEENVSRRQLHRQRLNWTKLVLSHHDSAWRQLFEFIDMRAESVENERPRTQERVRAAGLRSGDRSRDPELAATGIAADGSAKCYGRKLQKAGLADVSVLRGGMERWRVLGLAAD